jgi:Cu/Ag efflux protein CusF
VGKPYPAKGIVAFINLKEGWIEINHEAIAGWMPAMQMEWTVKDKSQLRSVRVGDKVDFVVVETGSGEIITDLRRATTTK